MPSQRTTSYSSFTAPVSSATIALNTLNVDAGQERRFGALAVEDEVAIRRFVEDERRADDAAARRIPSTTPDDLRRRAPRRARRAARRDTATTQDTLASTRLRQKGSASLDSALDARAWRNCGRDGPLRRRIRYHGANPSKQRDTVPHAHLDLDKPTGDSVKTTTCYMCACRCGIRVHLKDGRVRYIDGNPKHPVNRGVICAKGSAGIMQHYSPARLRNRCCASASAAPANSARSNGTKRSRSRPNGSATSASAIRTSSRSSPAATSRRR